MSLREELTLRASGLATFADSLSKVPEGSLSVANNIVIDKDGLISPRRGYELLDGTTNFGDISSIHEYNEDIIIHTGSYLYHFDDTKWTQITPSIAVPSGVEKIRSVSFANNKFFTSENGVQKIDNVLGPITNAGAPRGLNAVVTESSNPYGSAIPPSSTAATDTYQTVAFRILWGYKDANDNLILGAPSQRELFTHYNNRATDVDLKIYIPSGITTAWFFQVYRSDAVDQDVDAEPLDELKLAYEGNPEAADITAGFVQITDVQPEELLGASLYTNPTEEGILQANDEPPKCRDMALYQNHMFYANTETKHSTIIQLLGINPAGALSAGINNSVTTIPLVAGDVGDFPSTFPFVVIIDSEEMQVGGISGDTFASVTRGYNSTTPASHSSGATVTLKGSGLTEGDTVTIDGVAFTAKYTTTPGDQEFRIYSESDPGYDVQQTARSLVEQVNKYYAENSDYYIIALYISSGDVTSLPGQILLQESDFSVSPGFEVQSASILGLTGNNYRAWTPSLLTAEVAKNDGKENRIYYSKFQLPEAVPALNYFDVGASNDKILRILPLRTGLLIFTTTGIYRLTGTTQASFQVTLLDNTTTLVAADTAVVFNNAVYGLFDQGIGAVSQSVSIMSRPIEGKVLNFRGRAGANISKAFGIGYESDRKYILYVPTGPSGAPSIAYVYNTVTNTWTNYDLSYNHGIVRFNDDKLYMVGNNKVHKERKDYTEFDITCVQTYGEILAVNDEVVTVDANIAAAAQVDGIFMTNESYFSKITAVDLVLNTLTLDDSVEFSEPTTLNGAISDSDTTIIITDFRRLREGDIIKIGTEYIRLGTKFSDYQFDSCTRGYKLTTAAAHNNLDVVKQVCEVRSYIDVEIEWNPVFMERPAMLKQFSECTVLTNAPLQTFTLGFKTWTSSNFENVTFSTETVGLWGSFGWGELPWGGEVEVERYRTYIPRSKQRDSALILRLQQNTTINNFELSGFSIIYRMIGSRTER